MATSSNKSQPAKIEKTKLKLLKRFHVEIETGKSSKYGAGENNSQRNLKSDFDSARDNNDKSSSGSEIEEEKENEQKQIKKKNKRESKKSQEIEESNKI